MLNAMECANPDLQVRQNIALHHLLHRILLPRYGPLGVPHEGSSTFPAGQFDGRTCRSCHHSVVQLYVRADQPTPCCPVHPILHNAPCLTLPMHPLCHGRVWLYIWPHGLSNTILLSVPWQPAFGQILRAVGKPWLGSTQGPCAGVQIPASTVPCPPTPSTPTSRRTTSRQYRMMCCMHSCPTPQTRC